MSATRTTSLLCALVVIACSDDLTDASTTTFAVRNDSDSELAFTGGWIAFDDFTGTLDWPSASSQTPTSLCDGLTQQDVGAIPIEDRSLAANEAFELPWKAVAFVGIEGTDGITGMDYCAKVGRVPTGSHAARVCATLQGLVCPGPTSPPRICKTFALVIDDRDRRVDVAFTNDDLVSGECP